MPESLRRFLCARCGAEAFICTPCDRGQRYCCGDCARAARRRSLREANRRYQCTFNGLLNGAARSQRYRDRRRVTGHGVTDHGSLSDSDLGLLNASATNAVAETSNGLSSPIPSPESGVGIGGAVQCSFCGCWRPPWIRHGPLRRRSPRSSYIRKERRL